jgi:hypothetical protein
MFLLTQPMSTAAAFLMAHEPASMRISGHGKAATWGTTTMRTVSYSPRSLPAWVYEADVEAAVVPAPHGGSWLRADAQVTWYPSRTRAAHVIAARFHAVKVSVVELNPRPHTVSRTFRSARVIRSLAELLNGLRPAPTGFVTNCPAISATYRAAFAASQGAPPSLVATADGCFGDGISAAGKPGQELLDPHNQIVTALRKLLGLRAATAAP